MTLEGCVVRISDIIGYIGRDIEDAINLGLFNRSDIPKEIRLAGTDGYIMLKDVTIMAGNQNTRLSSLAVFCDEIVGVTVGIME